MSRRVSSLSGPSRSDGLTQGDYRFYKSDGLTRGDYRFYESFFLPRLTISRSPRHGTFKGCLSNAQRQDWTFEYYVPSNRLDIE